MYRLQPHRPIAHEVRRIADKQLMLALFGLRRVGTAYGDAAVDEARRHITRVRALMRLFRPALDDDSYARATRRLGAVKDRLAPIANGRAALGALARLEVDRDAIDAVVALQAIREGLVAHAARIDRKAMFDRVLPRSVSVLAVERARVGNWVLGKQDIRAIAPGLAESVRCTTTAMAQAIERPTAARDDAWRRGTNTLCLHVRLLEGRCTGLRATRLRLDALDECLTELHSLASLQRLLTTEVLGSRRDTATVLQFLRRHRTELRARTIRLGHAALQETPRQFVRRITSHWRANGVGARPGSKSRRAPHAA